MPRNPKRQGQMDFLARVMAAMGPLPCLLERSGLLVWRDGDYVNRLEFTGYSEAHRRVGRVAVNHYSYDPSRRVLRKLGFPSNVFHVGGDPDIERIQLTMLDAEAVDLAPWVAQILTERLPSTKFPPPPVPLRSKFQHAYRWTAAAWDEAEAHKKTVAERKQREFEKRRHLHRRVA